MNLHTSVVLDVLHYNIWIFPRKKLLISQIVSNYYFFSQYFFTGFYKSSIATHIIIIKYIHNKVKTMVFIIKFLLHILTLP